MARAAGAGRSHGKEGKAKLSTAVRLSVPGLLQPLGLKRDDGDAEVGLYAI